MPSSRVREWVLLNDFFEHKVRQGNDVFVPDTSYPHIHIGKGFVVFSRTSNDHPDLIRGDIVSTARAQSLVIDLQGTKDPRKERFADILQICRFIAHQF
ncbi:hypothetical protein ACCD06_05230 [Azospirillum sp. CT11-132]|uniref:hypothetical protein n=1 Tax=unclassified Azospirillum TaxID=2630922 RepID=UPI000D60DD75|nr:MULTISPECIES: hypothetical protein [unclassified Azospirillum]PWC59650.1 hypothetical protein TSH20_27355 [Azospirillum sp. TSH20]PWC65710.1 hypothetical protein TSH7_08090 [Azospirillum sp. TSH7]PWC94947.1 hypothetical protein TSO5_12185 [Azospirillum sp. TSO5]QCG95258.1 hypothetical protein E6C67_15320 [Azospirillum sp. TSA2s]